jgi:hypothetical protein
MGFWRAADEHEPLKALEGENQKLGRTKTILHKASGYLARAELDHRV